MYRLGSVETVNVTYSRFDGILTAVRRCFAGKDAETALVLNENNDFAT